jgi:8-oxo-dGTP pyrophosphatase MutT (NUDIX family)
MDCSCKNCIIIGGVSFDPYREYDTSQWGEPAKRAGVVVCNKKKDTILLVQSLGYKWGFAKGRVEKGERIYETASRELLEETGIRATHFENYINVFDRAVYYIHELDVPHIMIPPDDKEITGLMWIKLSCLEQLMTKDDTDNPVKVNAHCKYILSNYFRSGARISL